jgi:hypothetical protein
MSPTSEKNRSLSTNTASVTNLSKIFFLYSTISLSCILTNTSYHIQSVEPEQLWIAINTSLVNPTEKLHTRECVKIVLHNEDAQMYVNSNWTGQDALIINIDGNQPDGFMTDELVAEVRRRVRKNTQHNKCQPCMLVLSLVNTSNQVQMVGTESEETLDEVKLKQSYQMAKLLQFRTSIHQRYLVLVRFGHSPDEFGQCIKKWPYLKYPRRLVPIWEQVLFDYFKDARVLLAVTGVSTVTTRKEEGNFIWLCDEVVKRLDEEDKCKANMTETCKEQMAQGNFSTAIINMTSCTSYNPRH